MLPTATTLAFERELLASLQTAEGRFVYGARLPGELTGESVQVLIGTITGDVASATLSVRSGR